MLTLRKKEATYVLFLMFIYGASSANPLIDNAITVRAEAIQSLKRFHPQDVLPNFTDNPTESRINPNETGHEATLKNLSQKRLDEDKNARFVFDTEASRPKITPNPKSAEIIYAEGLLENPDLIIHEGCHKEPGVCTDEATEKLCEVSSYYEPFRCESPIKVALHRIDHPMIKRFAQKEIDLTDCRELKNIYCPKKQLITLNPRCEAIKIAVNDLKGNAVFLLKTPTCKDPTLIIDLQKNPGLVGVYIHVTEYWSEQDSLSHTDCEARIHDEALGFCVPDAMDDCLFPNDTKIIDGVPVTRACWGSVAHYQCTKGVVSTCDSLLNAGCSNTKSVCKTLSGTHCDVEEKTFQCVKRTCLPDKEVCSDVMYCADGSCDNTKTEESDDIAEGVSRLGALSGTAEEVAKYQLQTDEPGVFKGVIQECDTYTANLHNCCTQEGLLDDLLKCSQETKALHRAREEGRVGVIGYFNKDLISRRYVFCVFPTKLAGIIQLQGRLAQLGISFGTPKAPDCRGLKPSELEHINFKALNLTPITEPLVNRQNFPADLKTDETNARHVEVLHEKGASYD